MTSKTYLLILGFLALWPILSLSPARAAAAPDAPERLAKISPKKMGRERLPFTEPSLTKESNNFIATYCPGHNHRADYALERAEYHFNLIQKKLGLGGSKAFDERAAGKKMGIRLYRNKEDFDAATGAGEMSPPGSSILGLAEGRTLKTYPGSADFIGTLKHELYHLFLSDMFGPAAPMPLWLQEGFVRYWKADGRSHIGRSQARAYIASAIRRGVWTGLGSIHPEDYELNCIAGEAVLYFIFDEYGADAFRELCANMKQGKTWDASITAAFPGLKGWNDFEEAWENYVQRRM